MRRGSAFLLAICCCTLSAGQTTSPTDQTPIFRAESRLVLVDVVPEYESKQLHARTLLTDLTRDDFRIFDNGKEMPINSFDAGVSHGTRPLSLWLIVQCNLGFPAEWASGFLRGKTQYLRPAFAQLEPKDVVGVAHWCDDGNAAIDLPPGRDPDAALSTIDRLLNEKDVTGENRSGELAMQKMIEMILDNVHSASEERLPVLVILYNDHSATYIDEADRIIEDVLETSGIVFGIGNNGLPFNPHYMFSNGQVHFLAHYYSQQTGGQFYSTSDPKLFSAALDYILAQLHLRYTLGFKPTVIDGKIHTLKVELSKETKKRYSGAELRFRQAYVPVANPGKH